MLKKKFWYQLKLWIFSPGFGMPKWAWRVQRSSTLGAPLLSSRSNKRNFSTWGEQTQFPRTCTHCLVWKWVNTRYHFKNIYLIYKKITVSFFFGPIIISTGRNEKNFESEGRIAGNSLFPPVPLYCKKCLGGLKKGDIITKLIFLNVGQNLTRGKKFHEGENLTRVKILQGWKFNEGENLTWVKF